MNKKILAICDNEADYAYRLMEMLKSRNDFHFDHFDYFDLHVFTDSDKLLSFARRKGSKAMGNTTHLSNHGIDAVLINGVLYDDEVRGLAIPHVFILCGEQTNVSLAANERFIHKYQSVDGIAADILSFYLEAEIELPRRVTKGDNVKIVGVFSPVKRCLQTTFSLTMGQILAKKYRTLYLNFECFSGLGRLMGGEQNADITDMVYLFECVKEKFINKLPTITAQVNGLYYVSPSAIYPDLINIPGEQWTLLLNELRSHGDYQYIVLDLSEYVNGLMQILRECDRIYTITKGDYHALMKLEQYEQMLSDPRYENVAAVTRKLSLPLFKNVPMKCEEMTYGELAAYIREELLDDLYS
ncbi:MAG: hypothetical protein LBC96_07155 [Lachnospiraceae bacterium]|jgi:hypothetical protein|nr:hypothetical protein [Lachnospiraceae bacterium]